MKDGSRFIVSRSALIALTVYCAACSRSESADERKDEVDDGGSRSDSDSGTDGAEESGIDDIEDASEKGGASKKKDASAENSGSGGNDAPESVRCEDDGYCYYPDGHFCDPYGMCCYPDGHCVAEEVDGGVDESPDDPFIGFFGSDDEGGIVIDPEDLTDQPWNPLLDGLSGPGWRNSDDTLCTGLQNAAGPLSVWSDSRGVYILAAGEEQGEYTYEYPDEESNDSYYRTCVGEGCPRITLYFNNGSGWQVIYEEDDLPDGGGYSQLTGFENGPLIMYGWQEFIVDGEYISCGLAMIEGGNRKCEPIYDVNSVFVVNSDLAYGINDETVIRYDGEFWGPMPGAITNQWIADIWADETRLFAISDGGIILMLQDGVWKQLDTRTLESFSSIWGFGETDIWAGTYEGSLFHYDGEEWERVAWQGDGCGSDTGIYDMWGSDGVVFFNTGAAIGRIEDSEIEVINTLPCPDYSQDNFEPLEFTSIWGNSPQEVFIAVEDDSYPRRECGINYIIWYDGKQFHQF